MCAGGAREADKFHRWNMTQQLPKQFKFLCAKIALERTRPAQWKTAAELRKDTERVLVSGASVTATQTWLEGLLADALAAQHKT